MAAGWGAPQAVDMSASDHHTLPVANESPHGSRGIDWSAVDWGRSNAEIAAELGCSANAVTKARRKHGEPSGLTAGRPRAEEPRVNRGVRLPPSLWEELDAEAARTEVSTAVLLEQIATKWLRTRSKR